MFQRFSGVSVRRVIDRSGTRVPEHAHDWPVLSLFVLGTYANITEIGEASIQWPSAILYRAGAAHRNNVGSDGFEQIEIEFDPDWLGGVSVPDVPVRRWIGGVIGAEARSLALLCGDALGGERLRAAVRRLIERGSRCAGQPVTNRASAIAQRLRCDPALKISELAKESGQHPSWLGQAYKRATGEGLRQTAARLRVERAARFLRETDQPYATIAMGAGFCDQSHMNRTFRRVLGRLPSATRKDRAILRQA
jgi:AraC family transcriptional regulator